MSVEADLSWAKTWLKQEKKHYINGSWVAGAGELWNLKNPATGEILTTIPLADTDQVAAAARAAHHCHQGDIWRRKTSRKERAGLLNAIAQIIRENTQKLAILESLPNGT